MEPRRLWLLSALALAACGGNEPELDQGTAANEPPVAVEDIASQPSPGDASDAIDAAAAALPAAAASNSVGPAPTSARFQLGTHYKRLSPTQPTSSRADQVEVAEVFWYACPHCYNLDPAIKKWALGKPEYVNFIRIPAVWNDVLLIHARAFYTAEALGKGAEMHDAFFREIHVAHNMLDSDQKLTAFFGGFGIDAAAFKSAYDSFAVHTKLQRANELSRRYGISSVPTIVVNGKYVTDGSMAGGYEAMLELVNELVASEHAGN